MPKKGIHKLDGSQRNLYTSRIKANINVPGGSVDPDRLTLSALWSRGMWFPVSTAFSVSYRSRLVNYKRGAPRKVKNVVKKYHIFVILNYIFAVNEEIS